MPPEYQPGAADDGDETRPGLFDLLPLPVVPCTDTVDPGFGTIDCVPGELLPDPALPIDPCSVEVPLPTDCPVVAPE